MADSYRLYGQAMLARLEGRSDRLVIERDDGYRDPSDTKYLFAPYRQWAKPEQKAIRAAKGRVLDVGCGAGRVALYLQGRGLKVTAIDSSPEALEVAKRRGVRDARLADGCLLDFPRKAFDTVVMFGNNFGICGDFDMTRSFLLRVHRILRPGGRLIASTRIPGSWLPDHAKYVKNNVEHGRPPGLLQLRMVYGKQRGTWFTLLLVSPDDLLRLSQGSGWDVSSIFMGEEDPSAYAFVAKRR